LAGSPLADDADTTTSLDGKAKQARATVLITFIEIMKVTLLVFDDNVIGDLVMAFRLLIVD
jgi:hypothetical protein